MFQIVAQCYHTNIDPLWAIPHTEWYEITGLTVGKMLQHWSQGHRVEVRRLHKGHVIALAILLKKKGWVFSD